MPDNTPHPKEVKPAQRKQGRPGSADKVGRETLIATTRALLNDLPPAKVTTSLIARAAGADPALIRYYFGDRETLLLAVVDAMMDDVRREPVLGGEDSVADLEARIRNTFRFTQSSHNMHRLMIDEVAAKSPAAAERLRQLNLSAVARYEDLFAHDGGRMLNSVDPVMLHLAVIGISDFFASAEPVINGLIPDGIDSGVFTSKFEDFLTRLLIDGIRARG